MRSFAARTMTTIAASCWLTLAATSVASPSQAHTSGLPRIYGSAAAEAPVAALRSDTRATDPIEVLVQRALAASVAASLRSLPSPSVRPQWQDLESREAWLLTAMRDLYRDRGYRPIFVHGGTLAPAADILLATLESAWTHGLDPADYVDGELRELLHILRTPIEDPDLRHELAPDAETRRALHTALALQLAQHRFSGTQQRALARAFDERVRAIVNARRGAHASSLNEELARKTEAASQVELALAASLVRYALDMRLRNDFFAPSDPALDEARAHLLERGYGDDTDGTRTGAPPVPSTVGELRASPDEWRLDSFDALLAAAEGTVHFQAALDALPIDVDDYAPLRDALLRYHAIAAQGGWPTLAPPPASDDDGVWHRALADRLALEDHTDLAAWKHARQLPADTIVDDLTLSVLNIPVTERLAQLELALEKLRHARYARDATAGAEHIRVNVPSFHAVLWDNGEAQYAWRVIVGKVSSQGLNATPEMSAILTEIELNPYWYPPRRLMRADAPTRFVPPGPNNPMGRAKFIFPNADAIYMHDTNHRERFASTFRAYSSGCVRVENAETLAAWLISRDRGQSLTDGEAFVADRLQGGARYRYYLRRPLPVHIEYRTAYMEDGRVHFGLDLYGRDAQAIDERIAALHLRYPDLLTERARDRHARNHRLARRAPLAFEREMAHAADAHRSGEE